MLHVRMLSLLAHAYTCTAHCAIRGLAIAKAQSGMLTYSMWYAKPPEMDPFADRCGAGRRSTRGC